MIVLKVEALKSYRKYQNISKSWYYDFSDSLAFHFRKNNRQIFKNHATVRDHVRLRQWYPFLTCILMTKIIKNFRIL